MPDGPRYGVAYLRVSTAGQERDGVSLEEQRRAVLDAAAREGIGITPDRIFVEAQSGGDSVDERDQLRAAIENLRKGEVLVVYSWDRLARSVDVMLGARLRLTQKRCTLLSASQGWDSCSEESHDDSLEGLGRWMLRMMLYITAEYERRVIGIRVRAAVKSLKRKKLRAGRIIPYGFAAVPTGITRADGKPKMRLERHPQEYPILARIIAMRQEGRTFDFIVNLLNSEGVPTRKGTPWRKGNVHAILKFHAMREKAVADEQAAA